MEYLIYCVILAVTLIGAAVLDEHNKSIEFEKRIKAIEAMLARK